MRALRLILAVAALALLPFTMAAQCSVQESRQEPAPVAKCEEDEPCWNCHTMGNRRCGPDTAAVKL